MSRDCKHGQLARSCDICEKEDRIAELEKLISYLLPKAEYANDGCCPECDAYHLQPHGADCEFIKACKVLEGK